MWLKIVCSDTRGRDHVTDFVVELFLNTTVEEESNMSVFLGFSNVALLYTLLCEPFGEHVIHALGRESHKERKVRLVLGHGGDIDTLGEGEVGKR